MSTVMVGPLRQRMIEDMNARQLCAGTQRAARNAPFLAFFSIRSRCIRDIPVGIIPAR
jgi:hypothetical protein